MKKYLFVAFFFLWAFPTLAQKDTAAKGKASFAVSGTCNMCKNRIETLLNAQEGVRWADYDPKKQNLKSAFNPSKISLEQIHALVAGAGHDTALRKGDDQAYVKLPACCLYRDGASCDDTEPNKK